MANVKEIEAFLSELQTEAKENRGYTICERDKLEAPIDEELAIQMFNGYIIEGYTEGIDNYEHQPQLDVSDPMTEEG